MKSKKLMIVYKIIKFHPFCENLSLLELQDIMPTDKVKILDNRFIFSKNEDELIEVQIKTSDNFNEIRDY